MLPADARVCIVGLVAASQHNGSLGRVVDYSAETGRYNVEYYKKMADSAGGSLCTVAIKRENVRLCV